MICFAYTYKLNTQRQISYEAKKRKKEKKKKTPPNYLNVRCPPPFSTVGDESVVQHPHSGGWDNPFLYIFQAGGCSSVVECSPSMPKAPNSIPALDKQKLKRQRGRSRRNSLVIRQFSLRTPKTDVHELTVRAPCWRRQLHNSLTVELSNCCQHSFSAPRPGVFGTGRYSVLPKEKHKHQPNHKSLIYNGVLPAKYARTIVAWHLWE